MRKARYAACLFFRQGVQKIKGLTKVILFLLCFLSVGAASAYADPTITVERVRDWESGSGIKQTDVKVHVAFANDQSAYDTPLYLRKKIYLGDGTSSVWQNVKEFGGAVWPNDGVAEVSDTVPNSAKSSSCPDLSACVPVTKVDYIIVTAQQAVLAQTSFSVNGGTGGGGTGGGSDPGDGSGGGDPGGGEDTGGGSDPGDGSGGGDPGGGTGEGDTGGGGGGCAGCELLACPGWEDIADLFADEIGKEIPPPPDWEEVADVFADELVPRMSEEVADEFIDRVVPAIGDEMTDVLEDVLQHPDPPPPIIVPDEANFSGKDGVSIPQPVDSAPPAQNIDFDSVPDIQVNQDNTGGIDLSRADPIDSIPHTSPEYKPVPGKETGGIKPQTKPAEKPVPDTSDPPPLQGEPKPGTSTSPPPVPGMPMPRTGSGTPVPEKTTSPPPKPEMPMPSP